MSEPSTMSAWSERRVDLADMLLGGGLFGDDLQAVLGSCRAISARRGQSLLRAEDERAVLLLQGSTKAHASTRDGNEVITQVLGPGDTSGLLAALDFPSAGTALTALEPVQGLMIVGSKLRQLLPTHPEIALACLRTVTHQQAAAYGERLRFAGTSVTQRVAARLLALAERWGDIEGKQARITLLTQEELAAWSGASRESAAKALQLMRNTGLIVTGRRSLTVLDLPRLRERCEPSGCDDVRNLLGSLA